MSSPTILAASVLPLFIEMKFGDQGLSFGTGFIVEKEETYFLVTNRHNLTGRHQETNKALSSNLGIPDRIVIKHHSKEQLGKWVCQEELILSEGQPNWIEHPMMGASCDVVLLPLSKTSMVHLVPYDLGMPSPAIFLGPTENISVVGFPFGQSTGGGFPIWATGSIASELNASAESTFLIDCRSRQGQSGSPVIAQRNGGTVPMQDGSAGLFGGPITVFLGIYSGRINSESDIGIVWKRQVIEEILDSA